MSSRFPILQIARVTIEAVTPLSVSSGAYDRRFDTMLMRDANGLPALPGTSIAGVLRHLFLSRQSEGGDRKTNDLFGFDADTLRTIGEDHPDADRYHASKLHISWGWPHNQRNEPVEGIQLNGWRYDKLLTLLHEEQPGKRDNVRISADSGAVDDRGKFERTTIPPGTRLTFELALWSEDDDDPAWEALLDMMAEGFHIGGATRRGLGRVKVEKIRRARFDLRNQSDFDAYIDYQRDPHGQASAKDGVFGSFEVVNKATSRAETTLYLRAVDFVRIGSSNNGPLKKYEGNDRPDIWSLNEKIINWKNNLAKIKTQQVVFPGTSIKGALRHRTAFHFNRTTKERFAERLDRELLAEAEKIRDLFGYVPDNPGSNDKVCAGKIMIDDVFLQNLEVNEEAGLMFHNSIDRFSGGTRKGVLFSEELLFKVDLPVTITLLPGAEKITQDVITAFLLALTDLKEERLALGGGVAKGHGYFKSQTQKESKTNALWRRWAGKGS